MLTSLRAVVTLALLGVWSVALTSAAPSRLDRRLLTGSSSTKIRGVNLGGWFIIESWMTPSLFQKAYDITGVNATDQWTFMESFKNQTQAQELLQQHWSSWIVESDFSAIKNLGLNTVRLPVPHWAFNGSSSEPYFAYGEQSYISKALQLASKYGLDVLLDLHTAPNSQNGQDNSGHTGHVGFQDTNQTSNVNRLNSALQTMVKLYINDPSYNGVVKGIEVLNEPLCSTLGTNFMVQVYQNAVSAMKAVFSSSAPVIPAIVLHDCFIEPLTNWKALTQQGGVFANQQFTLDSHHYQVFDQWVNTTKAQQIQGIHDFGNMITWAQSSANVSRPVLTGEFSLAISCSDCVPSGSTSADIATLNRQWFETQTTAYELGAGWIFWSWKAENNLPWSFTDAHSANWIPSNITAKDEAL